MFGIRTRGKCRGALEIVIAVIRDAIIVQAIFRVNSGCRRYNFNIGVGRVVDGCIRRCVHFLRLQTPRPLVLAPLTTLQLLETSVDLPAALLRKTGNVSGRHHVGLAIEQREYVVVAHEAIALDKPILLLQASRLRHDAQSPPPKVPEA